MAGSGAAFMKIAIVGTGIAGNTVAHHLHAHHDISVFEAQSHIGGHTHTHDIELQGLHFAVDTGFIVFNDRTYPNFLKLLDELMITAQPTEMSFSVRSDARNLEYNGHSLNTLFAQRRNLIRPSFLRMIQDILRFNREAPTLLAQSQEISLGQYLREGNYRADFIHHYIIPMGAAIWSTDPRSMMDFPAQFFIRFFRNHGLLEINNRPQWYVVRGGSREYAQALVAPFRSRIHLNTPVTMIRRFAEGVEIHAQGRAPEWFDAVFIASHSDQALAMLEQPSVAEREVLGAIPYQENEAILHTDTAVLPKRKAAWAAWNYHIDTDRAEGATLTYNMNILQGLRAPETLCVTLNSDARIDPSKIIKRMSYAHPLYTPESVAAQARQSELNGAQRTFFCGAYWRNGFHEDGVVSALTALEDFNRFTRAQNHDTQLPLRRAS
jgi:predicted NAD/FAD-binding protein